MRDFGGMGGFESLFGGGRRRDTRAGQDIRVTVQLSLHDVATGVKKTVKLKTLDRCAECCGQRRQARQQAGAPARPAAGAARCAAPPAACSGSSCPCHPVPPAAGEGTVISEPCEVCRGEGRVRGERTVTVEIPAGVSTNNYLTLRGQGAAGPRNGPSGDLLVMLDIKDDDRFERQGDDLIFDLPLSFSQAALGGEHSVPTPYGEERLTVPPGTQPETVLRLRGSGLPVLGQNGKGDLLVRVHVWTPGAAHRRAGAALPASWPSSKGEPPKRSPGFWSKLKEALGA